MAGDIETWGSGFEKIRKACEQYDTPLPEISVTKGTITVFVKPAESYMAVLNQLKKSAINSDHKTSRIIAERCNDILNYMKDGSDYTLSEIATVIKLSPSRTRDYLRILLENNEIEAFGANRNRIYRLRKK